MPRDQKSTKSFENCFQDRTKAERIIGHSGQIRGNNTCDATLYLWPLHVVIGFPYSIIPDLMEHSSKSFMYCSFFGNFTYNTKSAQNCNLLLFQRKLVSTSEFQSSCTAVCCKLGLRIIEMLYSRYSKSDIIYFLFGCCCCLFQLDFLRKQQFVCAVQASFCPSISLTSFYRFPSVASISMILKILSVSQNLSHRWNITPQYSNRAQERRNQQLQKIFASLASEPKCKWLANKHSNQAQKQYFLTREIFL